MMMSMTLLGGINDAPDAFRLSSSFFTSTKTRLIFRVLWLLYGV